MNARSGLTAAVVAMVLVLSDKPAAAGPVLQYDGGGVCPQGDGAITWVTPEYPPSPESSSPGLTLPYLAVAPISTAAVISAGPGETFEPVTLTQVRARPVAKVLRDGTVDPDHALMQWIFRVQQLCPDTGQQETCDYAYHEMPDGSVFEVATLPGGGAFQHAGTIECFGGVQAFWAPGAPQDLGVRLLAAAKANVAPADIEANATAAFGGHIALAAGVPGLDLPPDVAAWAGLIAAAIGLGGMLSGPCGGLFVGVASGEAGVWLNLLTIPTAPPATRAPKAGVALISKIASTISFVGLIPTCIAQSVGSGGTLTALYELLMALGAIIWWTSTATLVVYGLAFAISFWT